MGGPKERVTDFMNNSIVMLTSKAMLGGDCSTILMSFDDEAFVFIFC